MNLQTQLLPHKHIRFSESFIGLAGCVRQLLKEPRTADEIWHLLNSEDSTWFYKPTFEQVLIAIVILFALGQIKEIENKKLSIILHHETH
ncbi:ABC-three component system middle component 6 [Thioflexithrix psekupsensis]|nr:ABC-three component system middle component 6 [Thioflexithrix psekupsensis]